MYGVSSYGATAYGSETQLDVLANAIMFGARVFSLLYALIVQPIKVNQNDYGYELGEWTLLYDNVNPQNLEGATVTLNVQDSQDPDGALLFSGNVAIDSDVEGLVHYTVGAGNFPRPGVFLAQLVATYGGEQISWPTFQIVVQPSLPQFNN